MTRGNYILIKIYRTLCGVSVQLRPLSSRNLQKVGLGQVLLRLLVQRLSKLALVIFIYDSSVYYMYCVKLEVPLRDHIRNNENKNYKNIGRI